MILRTCSLDEFIKRIDGREVVCFGAGRLLTEFCEEFGSYTIERYITYIVDNNPSLWGTKKRINNIEKIIEKPDKLYSNATEDTIILITCSGIHGLEVYEDINIKFDSVDIECYYARFIRSIQYDIMSFSASKPPEGFRANPVPVIPKKIHYCWVGGNPIPEKNLKCINSWKRFCPDYEIFEWNENNYDFTKNRYMKEAYDAGKWGFVPDYARLDIVYNHGGIYLDTDVEVIKPLDELLYNNAFCGFESIKHVNFGSGFGGVSGFPLLKEIRDSYNDISFIKNDGSLNLTPSPVLQTDFLLKHGLKRNSGFQVIQGLAIYPVDYFSPLSLGTRQLKKTTNTYSIHWFDGSWLDEALRDSSEIYTKLFESALYNEKLIEDGNR
jgi:hypothetical protein